MGVLEKKTLKSCQSPILDHTPLLQCSMLLDVEVEFYAQSSTPRAPFLFQFVDIVKAICMQKIKGIEHTLFSSKMECLIRILRNRCYFNCCQIRMTMAVSVEIQSAPTKIVQTHFVPSFFPERFKILSASVGRSVLFFYVHYCFLMGCMTTFSQC